MIPAVSERRLIVSLYTMSWKVKSFCRLICKMCVKYALDCQFYYHISVFRHFEARIQKQGLNLKINIREYRRGNQKWIIQRNWQHRAHKMKKNKTKTQHNMH